MQLENGGVQEDGGGATRGEEAERRGGGGRVARLGVGGVGEGDSVGAGAGATWGRPSGSRLRAAAARPGDGR